MDSRLLIPKFVFKLGYDLEFGPLGEKVGRNKEN